MMEDAPAPETAAGRGQPHVCFTLEAAPDLGMPVADPIAAPEVEQPMDTTR